MYDEYMLEDLFINDNDYDDMDAYDEAYMEGYMDCLNESSKNAREYKIQAGYKMPKSNVNMRKVNKDDVRPTLKLRRAAKRSNPVWNPIERLGTKHGTYSQGRYAIGVNGKSYYSPSQYRYRNPDTGEYHELSGGRVHRQKFYKY